MDTFPNHADTSALRWRGETSPDSFEALLASLIVLAWVVEARDPYTGGHLWRVSRYAQLLAQAVELPPAEVARISIGSLLHDLGKVGIPDAILGKPDRLTDAEYAVIKTHPVVGARMLSGHPLGALITDMVLLHHERVDGSGYPFGRSAEDASVAAHIVGVCDAFDAMTSHRPFRRGMPMAMALERLAEAAGTQFDATLVERFAALAGAGVFAHILGHTDEGIPLQSCPTCGPTLVLRREHVAGDHIACHNCTRDFELVARPEGMQAVSTGAMGDANQLAPAPDTALIQRMVEQAVRVLPVDDLFRSWHASRQ